MDSDNQLAMNLGETYLVTKSGNERLGKKKLDLVLGQRDEKEVKLGEEVETHLTYIDHDKKRIQYKLSMFHKEKKYLAATNEVLSLYVDLNQRKVVEFDPDRVKIMDDFIKKNSMKFNSDKLIFSGKLKK